MAFAHRVDPAGPRERVLETRETRSMSYLRSDGPRILASSHPRTCNNERRIAHHTHTASLSLSEAPDAAISRFLDGLR